MIYHLPDASQNSSRLNARSRIRAHPRFWHGISSAATGERKKIMKHAMVRAVSLGVLWLAVTGCTTPMVARYIYQDGEFGVVGIPVNNYQKRLDYRAQAEALMARHFPEGFQIVRAEEVNEGERIRDVGRKTELETEPAVAVLNQIIRLGSLNRTTSFAEKDKLQVRECRIIYKKKSIHAPGRAGQFASVATLGPPLYIDPNEVLRRQIKTSAELLAKADITSKKPTDGHVKGDGEIKQASATTPTVIATWPIPTQLDSSFEQLITGP
jgi:hypothetical protein